MATKRHDAKHSSNGPASLPTEEDNSPMAAATQTRNGMDFSPDRAGVRARRNRLKEWQAASSGWALSNWKFLVSIAIGAGALWLLPVTRYQLDDAERRIGGKIALVEQKVEGHDVTIGRIEDKVDKILFKLSDGKSEKSAAATVPLPVASSPQERPRPKAKRPHAQRVGFLARLVR